MDTQKVLKIRELRSVMKHKTDTLSSHTDMSRESRLLRVKAVYYLRVKVPDDLRAIIKKTEIRKSLKTKDYTEAVRIVRRESTKVDDLFEDLRRKANSAVVRQQVDLTNEEKTWMVQQFFVEQEKRSEEFWMKNPARTNELHDTLEEDALALKHEPKELSSLGAVFPGFFVNQFLKSHPELFIPEGSKAHESLRGLFHAAAVENALRNLDRFEEGKPTPHDARFTGLFAHTPIPPLAKSRMTLGQLVERFKKSLVDLKRSKKTLNSYATPIEILVEVIGADTEIGRVGDEEIQRLLRAIDTIPKNAKQRYAGLTIEEAIQRAAEKGDEEKLNGKTTSTYVSNLKALFNFARSKRMIPFSPMDGKDISERYRVPEQKVKIPFTILELNLVFHAPLYTGCQNDMSGYAKPGYEKPRRARFWLPLLGLYHGFRLNEACQIFATDVKEQNGIPCISINEEEGRRIKTRFSCRTVPLHPELIRIGFLAFVEKMRKENATGPLFPELTVDSAGYRSNAASKWFCRFAKSVLGAGNKKTFHTFRHGFNQALREAGCPPESRRALGGWKQDNSAEVNYGNVADPVLLLRELRKLSFDGLELSHLGEKP